MDSLLKVWKKQVRSSTLGRILQIYWKVFFNEERRSLGHRAERLFKFFKTTYKKKITKTHFTLESVVFCCLTKRNI